MRIKAMLIVATYCLALFGLASMLTGCSSLKYAECIARDNTSNPCN